MSLTLTLTTLILALTLALTLALITTLTHRPLQALTLRNCLVPLHEQRITLDAKRGALPSCLLEC